ncbi:ATP-binding protein [Actinotalea sp. AC32]|nr:ATP-binding protein [Actinotalea sp. AC32]
MTSDLTRLARRRPAPRVVLMCGPAGAGKSTVAHRLEGEGWHRLSFDDVAWSRGLRSHPLADTDAETVRAAVRAELLALVGQGRDVVVDSAFWSRTSRDEYRGLLAAAGIVPLTCYVETPRQVALSRVAARQGSGPHDVELPPGVAAAYVDGFEVPTAEEGPLVVVPGG